MAASDQLFCAADDGTHGQELWLHSDGYRVVRYAYDGLQRLTAADESSGATYTYSYDAAGNRTGVWLNDTRVLSQTFDAANQVVGGIYDAAGNLTGDGTTTSAYDALNRLVQQGSTSSTYNGDGVLVHSGAITYTQDLAAPLSQILQTKQGSIPPSAPASNTPML